VKDLENFTYCIQGYGHLGSTSFSLFLRLYPLTSDAMEVGIHLDIEDMIYYAFYKKLLIYVVYAFLLRFPSLFQMLNKYSEFGGGKKNDLIQSFCHIT
jgi:hypothetical protein